MMSLNVDFCGDTYNYILPNRAKPTHTKKTIHKLAQQIFNNKSLRAKNRIRKLGRLCAKITMR